MNILKSSFTLILFLVISIIKAQSVNSEKAVKSINREVINFLIQKKELQKGQSEEKYLEQITIVGMLDKENIGFKKNGIYMFRALFAPNVTFLFIKMNKKITILDPYYFSKTLKKMVTFLENHNTSENEIIKYTEKLIEIYKMNRYDSKYKL